MPAQLLERVLAEWRAAERLLEALSPDDPDHDVMQQIVARLRRDYARLAELQPGAPELGKLRGHIEEAHATIVSVRARLEAARSD
jgi:hypothetical protein